MNKTVKLTEQEKVTLLCVMACANGTCKTPNGTICPYLHDYKSRCMDKAMKGALNLLERLAPGITEGVDK